MLSQFISKLRARISRSENSRSKDPKRPPAIEECSRTVTSPVATFYENFLTSNLSTFDSFAIQSRSVLAKNVYARAASEGRHDFFSLQMEIDELLQIGYHDASLLRDVHYKLPVLLSLARYLLNTARSALDTHTGLQILRFVLLKYGDEALSLHHKLEFVEALASQGNYLEQAVLVERFELETVAPVQATLMAIDRIAREAGEPDLWLRAMNEFYSAQDMQTISLKDNASLPLLDRLSSEEAREVKGPLVSIIIPTFSPDYRLFTAVESLTRQSWSNLEIIIVDDGSPAGSEEILKSVEEFDARIRLIRQSTNRGAYAARNVGLAEANGEYVTTHDDDDWSHPDKIATQAITLMNDDSIVAITAAHIRTTQDMHFRRINSRPYHLQTNFSSLMFRRDVTVQVGGWDTSKRGSDTEFVERIRAHYGKSAVVRYEDKPLSFSRVWDGSLTADEIYRGYISYSRLLYRWSFRQWHRETKRQGTKPELPPEQPRPFAVPTSFEPENRNRHLGQFDVVYVTDFDRRSKFARSIISEMRSAAHEGMRVGYMHINSPQTTSRTEAVPELFELQHAGQVTQVAAEDRAEINLLIVYDAAIGMFLDHFKSEADVKHALVIHDNGTGLRTARRGQASHPTTVLRHLDHGFDTTFRIVGATHEDQGHLKRQVPENRLLSEDFLWKPHIATEPLTIQEPGERPIVGFHSYGNKYRWPTNRETFEAVYQFEGVDTFFYGNVKPVTAKLGDDIIPAGQWAGSNREALQGFFDMIDFWVHFPHPELDVRPWPAVLEALQAGKTVILPHYLQETYGDAAVYAEPEDVAGIVVEYADNSPKYAEQARRGQAFVERYHSRGAYLRRLMKLMD